MASLGSGGSFAIETLGILDVSHIAPHQNTNPNGFREAILSQGANGISTSKEGEKIDYFLTALPRYAKIL